MQANQPITAPGQLIGPYRLVRLLAHGNAGESWLADDTRFNRQVVVRMLPPVQASEQAYLQTFANQARLLAALEDPHILSIYDSGEHALASNLVVMYLVMPYIASGSLQERLRNPDQALLTPERLLLLRQTAQALDYAHQRQIIHGGLKPANILLQQGQVLLADFGLGRLLSDSAYRNRTYTVGIGSAEYMAPEQAQGRVEPASDRYSLAVIAYQLFTAHLPFTGQTPYEVMLKHIRDLPPPPRQVAQLPAAVDAVLLQGLAKQPADRAPSCVTFVDALYRAWNVQPPAQPSPVMQIPSPEQEQEDSEKTVLAPWSRRLNAYGTPPPVSTPQTPAHLGGTQYDQYAQIEQQAQPFQSPGGASHSLGGQNAPLTKTQPSPGLPAAPMSGQPMGPLGTIPTQIQETTPGQRGKINRRAVIIGSTVAAAALVGGSAALFSALRTGPQSAAPPATPAPGPHKFQPGVPVLSLTGHTAAVWFSAWDKSGRYLATCGEDHSVMVWDLGSLQKKGSSVQSISTPLHSWKYSASVLDYGISWSLDGRKLLVAVQAEHKMHLQDVFSAQDSSTDIVDISKIDVNNSLSIDNLPEFNYVAGSPKADIFAASAPDSFSTDNTIKKTVWLWQPQKPNTPYKTLTYTLSPTTPQYDLIAINELAYSYDGSKLAGLTNNNVIVVWDTTSGKQLTTIEMLDRPGASNFVNRNAMAWSPVDPNLILVSNSDTAMVYDIRKRQQAVYQFGINDPFPLTPPPTKTTDVFKWSPHTNGLTWSPNGRYIAGSYGRSATIYIWENVPGGKQERGLTMQSTMFGASGGHQQTVIDVSWSPDGRYIATTSYDTTVIIWKVDGA